MNIEEINNNNENTPLISSFSLSENEKTTIKNEVKSIFKLALPIMGIFAMTNTIPLVTFAMIGGESKDDIAAATLGTTIMNICFFSVFGIVLSLESFGSQYYGASDYVNMNKVFRQGIVICGGYLTISSIVLIFGGLIGRYILWQSDEISEKLEYFSLLMIPTLWLWAYFELFNKFLQVQNMMTPGLYANIGSNIVHGVLCYLFVIVFEMGIYGAAFALMIARFTCTSPIMFWIYYIQKNAKEAEENGIPLTKISSGFSSTKESLEEKGVEKSEELGFQSIPPLFDMSWDELKEMFDFKELWSFLRLCFWGSAYSVSQFVSVYILLFEASLLSTDSLVTHQYCVVIDSFIYQTFSIAMGIAGCIRVGNLVGQNKPLQAKIGAKTTFLMCISMNTLSAICLISLRSYIPKMFTSDDDISNKVSNTLIFVALNQFADAFGATSEGIIRSLSKIELAAKISFIGFWGIAFPSNLIYTFALGLGIYGIWLGLITGLACTGIYSTRIVYNLEWEEECRIAEKNRIEIVNNNVERY